MINLEELYKNPDYSILNDPVMKPLVAFYPLESMKAKKIALITGITGQDGSYLAEWLLYNDYDVHGIVRRTSTDNLSRIKHLLNKITLHEGDITDYGFINHLLNKVQPEEIYNLAAQSHVQTSFEIPSYTFQVNLLGLSNILETVRNSSIIQNTGIYQASTSEMFGNARHPQDLNTTFDPRSPYAVSKLAAHEMIKLYRESYGIHAVSGILFNHESPRRGEKFVTRKITKYFANIKSQRIKLQLGNIQALRDWGFAPDYVQIMHEALNYFEPRDFVLGTGQVLSVRDFGSIAANYVGVEFEDFVEYDNPDYLRPSEVHCLRANSDYKVKTQVKDLIHIMVDYDRGIYGRGDGYEYYMDNYGKVYSWR